MPPRLTKNRTTDDDAFHNLHPSEEVSIMLTTSTAEKLTNRDCEVSMASCLLHFAGSGTAGPHLPAPVVHTCTFPNYALSFYGPIIPKVVLA